MSPGSCDRIHVWFWWVGPILLGSYSSVGFGWPAARQFISKSISNLNLHCTRSVDLPKRLPPPMLQTVQPRCMAGYTWNNRWSVQWASRLDYLRPSVSSSNQIPSQHLALELSVGCHRSARRKSNSCLQL